MKAPEWFFISTRVKIRQRLVISLNSLWRSRKCLRCERSFGFRFSDFGFVRHRSSTCWHGPTTPNQPGGRWLSRPRNMANKKSYLPARGITTLISASQFLVAEHSEFYRFRRRRFPSAPDLPRQTAGGRSSRPPRPESSIAPGRVHALAHLFPHLSTINFPLWVSYHRWQKFSCRKNFTSSSLESSSIDSELWLDIDWRDPRLAPL